MTIKNIDELKKGNIEIDLTGPDGNALCLMGLAKRLCKTLQRDFEPILKEMKSDDYSNLIRVFDREFGDFVTLYSPHEYIRKETKDEQDIRETVGERLGNLI